MGFWKKSVLFTAGGCAYVGLELLWRGRSHSSMFLAGGSSFLLLGALERRHLSFPVRCAAGTGAITTVELLTGLLANREYTVWDYRQAPFNFLGQICLPFSLLWIPVGLTGMRLYRILEKRL